ncbi:MAG: hypothetical protein IIU11_11440 [Bacteroidales bacterium]|jgi:hypothetical protein|nr:hypothetical protein [Bacteroidales bacterium]MBR6278358.1 hypothetical protein [Bacteroidales bacterium]
MKKCILILSGLLLTFLSSKAQIVTSGDVLNLAGKTEVNVVFDYSETNLIRTDKTVEELVESNSKFAKAKDKQELYFIGSLNDDTKGIFEFGDYKKPQANLYIKVSRIQNDMNNPRFKAVFTDSEDSEIVTIEGIEQEDLNDAGHELGKFLYKKLKKVK